MEIAILTLLIIIYDAGQIYALLLSNAGRKTLVKAATVYILAGQKTCGMLLPMGNTQNQVSSAADLASNCALHSELLLKAILMQLKRSVSNHDLVGMWIGKYFGSNLFLALSVPELLGTLKGHPFSGHYVLPLEAMRKEGHSGHE